MKKILIVDDSELIRARLVELFKPLDCEIYEASDGKECMDLFKHHSPDIVTLDITMPIMDGKTALKKILKINPEAVVIMLTALGQRALIMECLKMGAKGYLIKPLNNEKVLNIVKKYL
jgi:two-component system, chemotaxis family, chemotaxis protein CheY